MKRITLIAALCFLSYEGMSIGRPHNVFATHKAITERSTLKQPKKNQPKSIVQVIDNAKVSVAKTKRVASAVWLLAHFFEKN